MGLSEKSLLPLFKLVRLDISLFSSFGIILSGLLSGDLRSFQTEYLLAFLIVFLVAIGSFALNDYFDLEADKKNKRLDRPLVSKLISFKKVLGVGIISYVLAIILSFFLNQISSTLILSSIVLFFFYNIGLKKKVLVKNIIIAYAYVATIILGSIITDGIFETLILYFSLMGFIVGLAFEIMLDIGDIEGDEYAGIQTLSTKFGVKKASQVVVSLYSITLFLDPLPFILNIDSRLYLNPIFLVLIMLPVCSYVLVSRKLIQNQTKNNIFVLKKKVLLIMQLGCTAYLIGVII
jgi:geranylgeranylglycerol-phosphate geranylgeranyltransferase